MRAMILAAGFGTRFRPATSHLPKPMIPLLNRPLLGWALERLIESGIREIVVNLHHQPDPIRDYLSGFRDRCDVQTTYEPEILGTGGGIRNARAFLGDDDFCVTNADTVQWPPLRELERTRRASGAVAVLLLRHPPEGERFTVVGLQGGRVSGFGDEARGEPLMFAGCHVLSPAVFDLLPPEGFSGITEDVYIPLTRRIGPGLAGVVDDGLWFDIGTPARYMAASDAMRRRMLSGELELPEGSLVRGSSVLHRTVEAGGEPDDSVLGSESVLGPGSRVRGSVLWDRARVGSGSTVEDSIVAQDVVVPAGSRLLNCLITAAADGSEEAIERVGNWSARRIRPDRPWLVEAG